MAFYQTGKRAWRILQDYMGTSHYCLIGDCALPVHWTWRLCLNIPRLLAVGNSNEAHRVSFSDHHRQSAYKNHSLTQSLTLSQLIAIRANNFHHEARSIYFSHHGHPVLWLSCSADGESRPHSMGSSCNAEQTTATSRRALQLPTRLWTFPS